MFNADKAIENPKDDLLGRAPFSVHLGRDIYEYKGNDSLVIAIYGKWGTGKTSIANMVLQEIDSLSKSNKNETIIIKFEPWNYSDKDNLVHHFFNLLENAISSGKIATLMKNVKKFLNDYSKYLGLIPYENPWYIIIWTWIRDKFKKESDINLCKDKLKEALIKANKKIVVLIDDIDRLTNSQIRNIIQIVKQIGDLPKITYILAMDREVVAHALEDDCCNNGNEYLEKIVQIPFQIPTLSQAKLHEIFHNKLDSSILSVSKNIAIRDDYYWYTVLNNCIFPYLYTIRDINRVINIFNFRYGILCEDIPFEEAIGITTIEVLNPKLFEWIANNTNVLWTKNDPNTSNQDDVKSFFHEQFKKIGIAPVQAIDSVATLFPIFASNIGMSISRKENFNESVQKQQFKLFLSYAVDEIKVPRSDINDFIYTINEFDLKRSIEQINIEGNLEYVIERITSDIDMIPPHRLKTLTSAFINLTEKPIKYNQYWCEDIVTNFVIKLIQKIPTKEERYNLYKDLLSNSCDKSLGFIAYKLIDERNDSQSAFFAPLDSLFLQKINAMSSITKNFLDIHLFIKAFSLWNILDSNNAQNYLTNTVFTNDVQKLKFICKFAGRKSVNGKSGWSFNENNYDKYIKDNDIYKCIKKLDAKKINDFTKEEKIKLASFILRYENGVENVGDEDAKNYVNTVWNLLFTGISENDCNCII